MKLLVCLVLCFSTSALMGGACDFDRGDVNEDGYFDSSDASYLSNYLYNGGADPGPIIDSGDVNDDGTINVADITYITNYLFQSGPNPPTPFGAMGYDCTQDSLEDCPPYSGDLDVGPDTEYHTEDDWTCTGESAFDTTTLEAVHSLAYGRYIRVADLDLTYTGCSLQSDRCSEGWIRQVADDDVILTPELLDEGAESVIADVVLNFSTSATSLSYSVFCLPTTNTMEWAITTTVELQQVESPHDTVEVEVYSLSGDEGYTSRAGAAAVADSYSGDVDISSDISTALKAVDDDDVEWRIDAVKVEWYFIVETSSVGTQPGIEDIEIWIADGTHFTYEICP